MPTYQNEEHDYQRNRGAHSETQQPFTVVENIDQYDDYLNAKWFMAMCTDANEMHVRDMQRQIWKTAIDG